MPKGKDTKWLKNIGKSVAFGLKNTLDSRYSESSGIRGDIYNSAKNLRETITEMRRNKATSKSYLNEYKGKAKELYSDAKRALESGDLYPNKDSDDDFDFGDDFNFGDDDDFGFGDDDGAEPSTKSSSNSSSASAAEISSLGRIEKATYNSGAKTAGSIVKLDKTMKTQGAIIAKGFEKQVQIAAKLSMNMIVAQQKHHQQQIGQLVGIRDNLNLLNTFNHDVMGKFIEGSLKYYDESLTIWQRMLEMQEERHGTAFKSQSFGESDLSKVTGLGGFDLSAYADVIKKNFDGTLPGMALSMGSMFLGGGLDFGPKKKGNPLGSALEAGLSALLPKVLDSALVNLDKSVANMVPAMLAKLTERGDDPNAGMMSQFFGQLFGIKRNGGRFDTTKYAKGAVAFDGTTHRTINQVIPTYLSEILGAIKNEPAKLFDHSMGKFTTRAEMKARHDRDLEGFAMRATDPLTGKTTKVLDQMEFSSDEERRKTEKSISKFASDLATGKIKYNPKQLESMIAEIENKSAKSIVAAVMRQMSNADHLAMKGAGYKYDQDVNNYYANIVDGDMSGYILNDNFDGAGGRLTSVREKREAEEKARLATLKKTGDAVRSKSTGNKFIDGKLGLGKESTGPVSANDIDDMDKFVAGALSDEKGLKSLDREGTSENKGLGYYLRNPMNALTDTITKIDNTLYDIIFDSEEGNGSIMGSIFSGLKRSFNSIQKFLKDNVFKPIKDSLMTDKAKAKLNEFQGNMLDYAKNLMVGSKKGGKYVGGAFSFAANAVGDMGRYMKQIFDGKDFTDSSGKNVKSMTIGIGAEMKKGFDSAFGYLKSYLFGGSDQEGQEKAKKMSLVSNITHTLSKGYQSFSNNFFGTKLNERQAFKDFGTFMKKKLPAGLAKGAVIGTGLSALSLTGGAGILGSLFLPGGPIGAMIAGTGISLLSQSDRFKNMLFGKTDDKGNRTGGVIGKGIQKFWKKNKNALIGGGMFGALKGALGISIPGLISGSLGMVGLGGVGSGIGAVGILPAMGAGLLGPVLMGAATGLAVKSKRFQELLYGKKQADGSKKGGLANSKLAGSMKKLMPGAAFGALSGWGLGAFGSSFGLMGSAFMGPMGMVLMGSALGIGLTSEKFKDALFGKFNEDGTYKSGLVDKFKNALTIGVVNPLKVRFAKGALAVEKWFAKSIVNPLQDAFTPLKWMFKDLATTIKDKVTTLFTDTAKAVTKPFQPLISAITKLLGNVYKGLRSATDKIFKTTMWGLGQMLSSPVKLVGLAAGLASGYYSMGAYKENVRNKFKGIGSAKGFLGTLSATGSAFGSMIGMGDKDLTSEKYKDLARARKYAQERDAKQNRYFTRKEAVLNKYAQSKDAFEQEILANGFGLTKKQIQAKRQELEANRDRDLLITDKAKDQITAITQKELEVQEESRDFLSEIKDGFHKLLNRMDVKKIKGKHLDAGPKHEDDDPANMVGGKTAEAIAADKTIAASPFGFTLQNFGAKGKAFGARHADDNVAELVGGRTGQAIMAERADEKKRQEGLALLKPIALNAKEKLKNKAEGLLDKIFKGMEMANKFLGLAGILGVVKSISDMIQGKGTSKHTDRIARDYAQKGARWALRNGETIEAIGRGARDIGQKAIRGAKTLPEKFGNMARNARVGINNYMNSKFGIGTHMYESKAVADYVAERGPVTSKLSHIAEAEARVMSGKNAADIAKMGANETEGALASFKKCLSEAADKIGSLSIVKDKLGPNAGKLVEAVKGLGKRITGSMFGRIAGKFAKVVAKTAATVGTGGLIQIGFSLYDAVTGSKDASYIFNVPESKVTAGMRVAASILNVILGLPGLIFVDLALECIAMFTNDAMDIKSYLAMMIYKNLPGVSEEDANAVALARSGDEAEKKAYEQKTGKELTKDEWRKIKDEQDDSENGIIAKARGTAVGRFLFGANDENGEYQGGLFSNMQRAGNSVMATIFGEADTGDYKGKESIFSRLWSAVGDAAHDVMVSFIGGTTSKGVEKDSLPVRIGNGIKNNLKWLFGEVDDDGNVVQESAISKARKTLPEIADSAVSSARNTLVWAFGGMNDEGQMQMPLLHKGINTITSKLLGFRIFSPGDQGRYPAKLDFQWTGADEGSSVMETYIINPFSELSKNLKESWDNLTGNVKNFAAETANDIQTKGAGPALFNVIKKMIFGLAGWNMDFDPVAAAGKAVQTAASDFFTGVANWFDDVKKFWNSITPSGAAKAIIKGILKPLPMGAGDKIADILFGNSSGSNGATFGDRVGNEIAWAADKVGLKGVYNSFTSGKFFGSGEGGDKLANANNVSANRINEVARKTDSSTPDGQGLINYKQTDSRWGNTEVLPGSPGYGSISDYGCGPTVLASAMANVTGNTNIDPKLTASLVQSSDAGGGNSKGISPSFFAKAASRLGGSVYNLDTQDPMSMLDAISQGGTVILGGTANGSSSTPFTKGGHYVMAKGGYVQNGKAYVNVFDPLGKKTKGYAVNEIMRGLQDKGNPGFASLITRQGVDPRNFVQGAKFIDPSMVIQYQRASVFRGKGPGAGITGDTILEAGKAYMGIGYNLGASGDGDGLDCGLFTQKTFADCGLQLTSRCADDQFKQFESANATVPLKDAKPGDLVFFLNTYACDDAYKDITHVGIFAGQNTMLHCGSSKGVCFQTLDGYFEDKTYYLVGSIEKLFGVQGGVGIGPGGISVDGAGGVGGKVNGNSAPSKPRNPLEAFMSRFQEIGRNAMTAMITGQAYTGTPWDTAGSSGGSMRVGGPIDPMSGDSETNAKHVYKVLKDAGYSASAIAGIMGRLRQENNFKTDYGEEYDSGGTTLGGAGMVQWNGDRRERLKEFAAANGVPVTSAELQTRFMLKEIEEQYHGVKPSAMNSLDPHSAAARWTNIYEGGEPSDNEYDYADDFYQKINSGYFGGNKTGSGPIAKSPSTSVMRTLPNMSMFGGGDTTILKHLDLNTKKKYNYIPSTKFADNEIAPDYDAFGNIIASGMPENNLVTANDSVNVIQGKHEWQLNWWNSKTKEEKEAIKKANKAVKDAQASGTTSATTSSDKAKESSSTQTGNVIEQIKSQYESAAAKIQNELKGSSASAVDKAISATSSDTSSIVSAIRSIDITAEARAMVKYLEVIAGKSVETAQYTAKTADTVATNAEQAKQAAATDPSIAGSKAATIPAQVTQQNRNNPDRKTYKQTHQTNLDIAKGGEFRRS